MAFISGNNLGGKDIDYYDNPNYDPKNDGKSKGDEALKKAAQSADWAEESNRQYYDVGIDYDYVVEAENEAAYDAGKLKQQQDSTVSYFRAKERERLNPGGVGSAQINPRFSEPVPFEDKLSRIAPGYDDWLDNQIDIAKNQNAFDDMYGKDSAPNDYFERPPVNDNSIKIKGDGPLAKTVAGVNQELQAVKARTRDAAMEFRGRVYDFIDEVTKNIHDDFAYQSIEWDRFGDKPGGNMSTPPTYSYIENKYFPNSGDKAKARNTILKMIDSTDNEPPLNSLRGVTEEIAAVKDPGLRDMGIGAAKTNRWGASNENTLKNLESGLKEFQAWKAKKGVPRIIRLIQNLP
jgi:hypothetical protein